MIHKMVSYSIAEQVGPYDGSSYDGAPNGV